MKLDKQDKKILIWGFIIGTILNIFIYKCIEIVIMLLTLYFIHKYEYLIKKTENMEFIDKEKYIKGLDNIIKILDIYIVIKIILTLTIKIGIFNGSYIVLIGQFMFIYTEVLQRKYVKSIDGIEIERKMKLINNKFLVFLIFTIFIGFTYNYFNNIEFEDNHINSPTYEYKRTYNEQNKNEITFKSDYFKIVFTEDEKTEDEIDKYIDNIKLLSIIDILEEYSKTASIFMLILAFSQINFKDKKQSNTVFANVFLILALIFSLVAFNNYSIDLEYKILR